MQDLSVLRADGHGLAVLISNMSDSRRPTSLNFYPSEDAFELDCWFAILCDVHDQIVGFNQPFDLILCRKDSCRCLRVFI